MTDAEGPGFELGTDGPRVILVGVEVVVRKELARHRGASDLPRHLHRCQPRLADTP